MRSNFALKSRLLLIPDELPIAQPIAPERYTLRMVAAYLARKNTEAIFGGC